MGGGSSKKKQNLNKDKNKSQIYIYNNNFYQNEHNEGLNNGNIDADFKGRFSCKYEINELQNILKSFIQEKRIQDSFFDNESGDYAYDFLKRMEKEELSNFFDNNLSKMIDFIGNKAKEFLNNAFSLDLIASKLIDIEGGNNVYFNKIKKEISKINNDENQFEIKYLTVMLVGKSGVGKSTLINSLLKLEKNKAEVGTGNFQTTKLKAYQSKEVPFLRLVDTRGIELNVDYGAEAVKRDAENFINAQTRQNNPNNFVHCIWYCITGNRFEQVEIDLLNSLRSSYVDNNIPIIIIYTQATDDNTINEMESYIKGKNINANFIKVLAERKILVNKSYLEAFGLDELVKETLEKCKKALRGEMRSVMTNNISNNIINELIKENEYILKYINECTILEFTRNYNTIKSDNDFINFIINIFGININYFLEKKMNKNSIDFLRNEDIIKRNVSNYIKCYKDYTSILIEPILKSYPYKFIDYQVIVQKEKNKEIQIKNKRTIKQFIETATKFLNDNYYYISQVYFIYYIILKICGNLSKSFENNLNKSIKEIITNSDIQRLITECFLKKFGEFEKKISQFILRKSNQNNYYENSNQNYNYNYNINNNNNLNINNHYNNNDLPSYSQVINSRNINYNNEGDAPASGQGYYPKLN